MTTAAGRATVVLAVIAGLAGCATSGSSPAKSPTAAPSLATCGQLTATTGALRDVVEVRLSGPHTLPTGADFAATVTVSLRADAKQATVSLMTGAPVLPVIVRGTDIVGEYEGAVGGVGLSGTITRAHPYRFPKQATVSLRGCPHRPVDPVAPDATRRPLPPGRYTVYAYIDDESSRDGEVRSEPFDLTVTAATTQPAPTATVTATH